MLENLRSVPEPTFLIVVSEVLVGQDIAEAIRASVSAARLIIVTGFEAAVAALTDVPALTAAFLQCRPDALENTPLMTAITRCGGRFVLIGHSAEMAAAGAFEVLTMPFASDDIVRIIG